MEEIFIQIFELPPKKVVNYHLLANIFLFSRLLRASQIEDSTESMTQSDDKSRVPRLEVPRPLYHKLF